jgi:hypothetical protein
MTGPIRVAVLLVTAAGTLALGGCRGGVAAAPAPGAGSTGSSAGLATQGAAAGGSGAGASTDPLGSIESSIAAIEKQVDQDGTG